MKTDKTKLFEAFWHKAYSMAGGLRGADETRIRWEQYLESVGCRVVSTPNGLLPLRDPNILHVIDPFSAPKKDWHIQVPREIALKILAIGLP